MREHVIPVPGGGWHMWRTVAVRGTGFPARLVTRLGAPEAARLVDDVIAAEQDVATHRQAAFTAIRVASAADATNNEAMRAWRKLRERVEKGTFPPGTTGAATEVDEALGALRAALDLHAASVRAASEATARAHAEARQAVRDAASDRRFLEAVTWQNRQAVQTGIAALLRSGLGRDTNGDRQHEAMVVNYLQRYCTKNDTIGFFGPWGWAEITEGNASPVIDVAVGPGLLSTRHVYFEQWPMDVLAETLAKEEGMRAWTPPRRLAFVRVRDGVALSPLGPERTLSRAEELVLAACDGERLPAEIAATLLEQHGDVFELEADVEDALHALADARLVAWKLEVPLRFGSDQLLRDRLERIGDEELRSRAVERLDALDADRRAVAAAAGDPDALIDATSRLERTFVTLTGEAASRNAGQTYGGRGVVFEDTVRDVAITIGPAVLEAIGPALSLVLTSARWLTYETARGFRAAFIELYCEVGGCQNAPVAFVDFWLRAQRLLYGAKVAIIDNVVAELERRWGAILAIDPALHRVELASSDLAAKVEEAFAAPGPGWSSARHHSPDLMVATADLGAFRRGEFTVVLGEVHPGMNSLDQAATVHANASPERLLAAVVRDIPEPRFFTVRSKDWPKVSVRTLPSLVSDKDLWLETSLEQAPAPRSRVVTGSQLTVQGVGDRVMVRSADGRVDADMVEIAAQELGQLVAQRFRLLPRASSHAPRVTIDRLVVARETWTFAPSELDFAKETDAVARFTSARRWATKNGLPRFVFAKASVEVKPFYVDLESPAFLTSFAKIVRKAQSAVAGAAPITISEMLPGLDQLWLPDAAGELYTCELRCVVVDPRGPVAHG